MTEYSYKPKKGSYNFLDSEFDYWDNALLPTPLEMLQTLRSDSSGSLTKIVKDLGILDTQKQADAEKILRTFLHESGNPELIQKYRLSF